ncbi:3-hydroxy-2-methylbutyryl-CoA dehydrogenase [Acuticoccus sediminis]|uniref:3-hydroxy-2-methylbutyryl-CoA dehydrogenase n=1 Tax=Acuticoccus sediminis TaxID=2184697 RepID=A0A8B2NLA9_9HYPH|nr:SDR family NAD(P)-dependent oxidoreductase [Acuticoccus sediminis]RAH97036.1 3-hydroxy-2-methylbutyryl-CoA dehydrogenase [Acuticoccus sediminis]
MKIDGSVAAIITGGASGLGAATARALAVRGAKVTLFDLNAARGEALAAEIGGTFAKVDVADEASAIAGFEAARSAHGQERILINCAGIGSGAQRTASIDRESGKPTRFPTDRFEKVIAVNLVGTFRCIALAAEGMLTLDPLEHGERGAIVNTASVAAEDGQIGQVAYTASKAGIVGMTLPIARDLSNAGIRVNTILPGIFDTPLLASAPEKVRTALSASVPFPQRLGDPDEYAQLALTMIECSYFNGEDVRLDGAIRMSPR